MDLERKRQLQFNFFNDFAFNFVCVIPCSINRQLRNGLPIVPVGQEHTGVASLNSQLAPKPHTPSQGFLQELFIQAGLLLGHSLFVVHSG